MSSGGGRADRPGPPVGLLGRVEATPPPSYRLLLAVFHVIGRGLFGFRAILAGRANLPHDADGRPLGRWIAAALPHRTWVDPLLVADLLPREPRLVFVGDGQAIHRSWWRRLLVRWIGGIIPIWPGGGRRQVEAHITGARAAIDAGTVLVIFPEVGPTAPLGTARPLGLGIAYLALRTGAPIVPLVIGGGHELFRGRRLVLGVLRPLAWQELADLPAGAAPPAPWSSDERRIAHQVVAALHARTGGAVAAAHRAAEPPDGTPRRWTWLTTAWR